MLFSCKSDIASPFLPPFFSLSPSFFLPFSLLSSPSLTLYASELPGMTDHQMRSVFAQLLQGQAEIKQQLADLQRQCSQVGGKWGGGDGGGGWESWQQ